MFNEQEIKKDAYAKFRIGLSLYIGSALLYLIAGAAVLYSNSIDLDGTPSPVLLRATAFILLACISAIMFYEGRKYTAVIQREKLEDISSVALFYTMMGIPFALGFGSIFFFLVFRRSREPEAEGNICPYCGGYIILDQKTGEAYCIRCGRKF